MFHVILDIDWMVKDAISNKYKCQCEYRNSMKLHVSREGYLYV